MATIEGTNAPDALSTLTELEDAGLVEDPGYSSGDVSSRLHPEKLDFDHINTLETFTEDLKQALNGSFPRSSYPYSSVNCLFLSWADDDLNVQLEIPKLQEVFERQFRFTTQEFKIPSKPNPTRALQDKLYAFQNAHQDENELLIVYYAGHGEADSRRGRSIWTANRHRDSPFLNWSSLQHLLETAIPHVLIILDCCFAANAARDTTEGTTKELLAACGRENPTLGVGERSFTSALIEELKAFKSNPFTVAMLHSRLICIRWRLKYTPILAMLSEQSTPSIHLAPIPVQGASSPTSLELGASIDTRVLLAVSVAQNVEYSVTDWINWLNTHKAPAEILNIDARIESAYKSHSTLILLSVPTFAWSRMVDRDAYDFIGFVRSENLLRKSEVQDLDATKKRQSQSQLSSQNLKIDESVKSKRSFLAQSWSDSGYVGDSGNRDSSIFQRQHSGSIRRRPHPIYPSALYNLSVQQYLTVTSFHNVADQMQEALEDKDFREDLTALGKWFRLMSEAERTGTLMEFLGKCTDEQQEFIREFLSMKT